MRTVTFAAARARMARRVAHRSYRIDIRKRPAPSTGVEGPAWFGSYTSLVGERSGLRHIDADLVGGEPGVVEQEREPAADAARATSAPVPVTAVAPVVSESAGAYIVGRD